MERHNRKTEWINNMEKLQDLAKGLEAIIQLKSLRATLIKVPN